MLLFSCKNQQMIWCPFFLPFSFRLITIIKLSFSCCLLVNSALDISVNVAVVCWTCCRSCCCLFHFVRPAPPFSFRCSARPYCCYSSWLLLFLLIKLAFKGGSNWNLFLRLTSCQVRVDVSHAFCSSWWDVSVFKWLVSWYMKLVFMLVSFIFCLLIFVNC